ncbi:hypothetical protein Bca52824_092076 [Brassica carinata]|uniref:Cytochrome P450 n=1 Tax=Brassica carinata TaxID=52824 RepID=A0A8X7TEG2_BRACI|nr:hypothetical protein Bca52824_092076 [Brassica carinata]
MKTVWGEDASEFKPERWVSESGKSVHEPSYKFLSFNAGPRTCLGKEVALTQMKSVAVKIIQNYEIKMVEGQKSNQLLLLFSTRSMVLKSQSLRHVWSEFSKV